MDKYNVDLKFDRKTLKFGKSPNTCEFIDFHLDNPKVWELYLQFASDMVHHGHKKLSSEMLINRVRWETMVNTTDKQFLKNVMMRVWMPHMQEGEIIRKTESKYHVFS